MGLKWMQWIGLKSSTFGEICEIEGYLHSIDSFLFMNQAYNLISYIISLLKYCVFQSGGGIA
jgi:hypothetical protein